MSFDPLIFRLKRFKRVGTHIRMLEIAKSFDVAPLTNCIINLSLGVVKRGPLYRAKSTHMGVLSFLKLAIPFLLTVSFERFENLESIPRILER